MRRNQRNSTHGLLYQKTEESQSKGKGPPTLWRVRGSQNARIVLLL